MKKLIANLFKKTFLIDLLILLLLGLHVFIGLKKDLLYIGGDTGIPMKPIENLKLLFVWQNQEAGIESLSLGSIFQLLFFALFEFLGFSLVASQHIYIYLAHTLAGLAMYFLVNSFPIRQKRTVALIASIFYMFSPWIINYLGIFVFFPYSVMPFVLALFIRGLSGQMNQLKSILLLVLAFLGIIINFPQYSMYFVALLLIFLYFLFYVFVLKGNFWSSLKYLFLLFLFLGLTSLWFVLPYLSFFSQTGIASELQRAKISTSLQEFGDYGYATVLQLLRMFGAAGFLAGGATYSQSYLKNPILIVISYFLPLFVFGAILLKPRSKSVLFFSLVAIIFIFIAKGVNSPWGRLHFWLVNYFPLARAFRTTWNLSLGENLAYAFLIGITITHIATRLGREKRKFFVLLIFGGIVFILVNSWPLMTGSYFQYRWNPPNFEGVKIPQSYYVLEKYLGKENTDSRFFKIPPSDGKLMTNWGYFGSDFFFTMFSRPFIVGHPAVRDAKQLINGLYDRIENQSRPEVNIYKTLSLLNVKQLVFDGYIKNQKAEIKDKFCYSQDSVLEKEIDKFTVCKINPDYFLPHFYTPQKLIYTNAEPADFIDLAGFPDYQLRSGILPLGENQDFSAQNNLNNELIIKASPTVSFAFENEKQRVLETVGSNGIFYPYVRWRPGSYLHPLILKKEELEMEMINKDPRNIVDKSLFYASKRMTELKTWKEVLSKEEWLETSKRYNQLFENIFEQLSRVVQGGEERMFLSLLVKTKSAVLSHKGRLASIFPYHRADLDQEEIFNNLFQKIETKLETFTQLPELFKISYLFNVPQDGSYEMFFAENSSYFQQVFLQTAKLQIDSDDVPIEALETTGEMVRLKRVFELKKGDHRLELYFADVKNLLSTDRWQQQAGSLFETEEGVMTFRLQKPFPQEELPVAFQPITNYSPDTYYQLSFDYLAKSDQAGFSVIQDVDKNNETGDVNPLLTLYLPGIKDNQFRHFKTIFKSSVDSQQADFYLLVRQEQGKSNTVNFKNIEIKPVFRPTIIFKSKKVSQAVEEKNIPQITFVRVNPTKYRVEVRKASSPYWLIFSESFHRGWKVYLSESIDPLKLDKIVAVNSYFNGEIQEGEHQNTFDLRNVFETRSKMPIADGRHFLINSYANSWLIKPDDVDNLTNYELIVEFKPQIWFWAGLIISLFCLLGGVVCICYQLRAKIRG